MPTKWVVRSLCVIALLSAAIGVVLELASPVQAQPPGPAITLTAPYRVTVGTDAVQLTSSGNVNGGVLIKCLCSGQTVYLGASSAVTTSTGYPLSNGDSVVLAVRNANQVYAIASAAAQSVAVLPFSSVGQ